MSVTTSQRPRIVWRSTSSVMTSMIVERSRAVARGVKAFDTKRRRRWCSSPSRLIRLAVTRSHIAPDVMPLSGQEHSLRAREIVGRAAPREPVRSSIFPGHGSRWRSALDSGPARRVGAPPRDRPDLLIRQDREPRVEDIRATAGGHRVDGHDDSSLGNTSAGRLRLLTATQSLLRYRRRQVSGRILIFRLAGRGTASRLYGCD